MIRLPPEIRKALEETGLEWTIKVGGRHWKIILDGNFVGIIGFGSKDCDRRATLNIVSQIRRSAKRKVAA